MDSKVLENYRQRNVGWKKSLKTKMALIVKTLVLFIEVYLIYNVWLALGVQHRNSALYMYVYICVCIYVYNFSDSFPL